MTPREQKYHQLGYYHGCETRGSTSDQGHLLRQSLSQAMHLPEDQAVARTIANYEERLSAQPPLAKHPELRGLRGCIEAYNHGVAHGAHTSLTNVILRANFLHMITAALRVSGPAACGLASAPTTRAAIPAAPGCTLVYFPTSDRGPLVANNNDGLASHRHRDPPGRIVSNRAGMIIGTVSSGLFDDEISPEPFPVPAFLMVDELCTTTSQAVDLLTRLNLFWGPCNTLIADRHGHSAVIEKSTCRFGLRTCPDGFAATTEMSAEEPAYKAYLWSTRQRSLAPRSLDHDSPDWAYWKTCERRSARLHRLLDEAKSAPTFAALQRIIYDHTGQPEQIHMDGSKCHPDQEAGEWSLRTTIWVTTANTAQISFADPPTTSSHLTPREWITLPQDDYVF